MMIIGCDLQTRHQQVAMLDTSTGEMLESRLEQENGEARAFYAALTGPVRVGIEATGHTHWFDAMLAELGHELWMETRPRSGPWWCASRRRMRGMRRTYCVVRLDFDLPDQPRKWVPSFAHSANGGNHHCLCPTL